jgi:hypothetical protein
LGQAVFGFQLGPFGIQDVEEVDHSAFVAYASQFGGRSARFGGVRRVDELIPAASVGYEGIFSLFQGLQYRLLVLSYRGFLAGLGAGHPGVDPA